MAVRLGLGEELDARVLQLPAVEEAQSIVPAQAGCSDTELLLLVPMAGLHSCLAHPAQGQHCVCKGASCIDLRSAAK